MVLLLQRNIRVQTPSPSSDDSRTSVFVNWFLRLGNGNIGEPNDSESSIDIPDDMLMHDFNDPFKDFVRFVYPNILDNISDPSFFEENDPSSNK